MRSLQVAAILAALLAPGLPAGPIEDGPAAVLTDSSGARTEVKDLRFVIEEVEGGTVFQTRLPHLPLRRGAGEWRIPLAAIRSFEVKPGDEDAAVRAPREWTASLAVEVGPGGEARAARVDPGTGVQALDESLVRTATTLAFRPAVRGGAPGAGTTRLRAEVRLSAEGSPPTRGRPRLRLALSDGSSAEGELASPGILAGSLGGGEFRIALADVARCEIAAPVAGEERR